MAVKIVVSTTVPTVVNDDILVFQESSGAVVTDVDWSSIDLQRVSIPSTWTHDIGTAGNPLHVAVSNVTTVARPVLSNKAASGTLYYRAPAAGCDELVHAGASTTRLINGATSMLAVLSGTVVVDALATATNAYCGGGALSLLDDGSTGPTLLQVVNGSAVNYRGSTTTRVDGGSLLIDASAATTTLEVRGGVAIIRKTGTITNLVWMDGDLNIDGLPGTLTVTNLTVNMSLPHARALLDSGKLAATTIVRALDASA